MGGVTVFMREHANGLHAQLSASSEQSDGDLQKETRRNFVRGPEVLVLFNMQQTSPRLAAMNFLNGGLG